MRTLHTAVLWSALLCSGLVMTNPTYAQAIKASGTPAESSTAAAPDGTDGTSPAPGAEVPKGAISIPAELQSDRDFRRIEPAALATPGKTEVIVFIWYNSPWCEQVVPMLRRWLSDVDNTLSDVRMTLAPAVMGDDWAYGARVFYALEELHAPLTLHLDLMEAIQKGTVVYSNPQSLMQWLGQQGIDTQAFATAINSPQVVARAANAPIITRTYQVQTVPAIALDGQYLIGPDSQTTPEQAVAKARYMMDQLENQRSHH